MRREDRKINTGEANDILKKGEYGVLSMCTTHNEGYGIPLHYVLDNDIIYFHCAVEGLKLDYLKANNQVSFCVVGDTEIIPSMFGTFYESAIAFGRITEVEGVEKREALMMLIEKYAATYSEEGKKYIDKSYDSVKVLKLSIQSVTGKARKINKPTTRSL